MHLRLLWPITIIAVLMATAYTIGSAPGTGRSLSLSLVFGALLGVVLQRSRFCFLCHARDFIDRRDPRGLLAILLALAVGTIGYHLFMSGWLTTPNPPRLRTHVGVGTRSSPHALGGEGRGS